MVTSSSPPALPPFVAAVAAAVVLLASVLVAWLESRPTLDAEDARRFAVGALNAAGFEQVSTAPEIGAGASPVGASEGNEDFRVWIVEAEVEGGSLELDVDRSEAQAVRVVDAADGGGPLLDNDQVRIIDDYSRNPDLDDRFRRDLAASVAGVLGAAVALTLAAKTRRAVEVP